MFLVKVFSDKIMKGFFELGSAEFTWEKSGELIVIAPPNRPMFSLNIFFEKMTGYLGRDI